MSMNASDGVFGYRSAFACPFLNSNKCVPVVLDFGHITLSTVELSPPVGNHFFRFLQSKSVAFNASGIMSSTERALRVSSA